MLRAINHTLSVVVSAAEQHDGRLHSTGMCAFALISTCMRRLGIGTRLTDCMCALSKYLQAEAAGTCPVRCRPT